jgi:hypothetical protein
MGEVTYSTVTVAYWWQVGQQHNRMVVFMSCPGRQLTRDRKRQVWDIDVSDLRVTAGQYEGLQGG